MCWVKLANVAHGASPRVVLDLLKESDSDAKNGPKWREFGGLALLQAAEHNGDVNVLKALLQHGVEIDVNCRDDLGRTALHLAVTEGKADFVEFLFTRNDLDVNACALFDLTPLHLAARLGRTKVLRCILEDRDRVRLDCRTVDDFTALHLVVEGDDAVSHPYFVSKRGTLQDRCRALVMLLEELERRDMLAVVNARDSLGRTALHYAAEGRDMELLEPLTMMSNAADLNAIDYHGFSPLHLAVRGDRGDKAAASLLQIPNINANVEALVTLFHPHVLMVNSCENPPKCQKLFPVSSVGSPLETSSKLTALHLAAREGKTSTVRALLGWRSMRGHRIDVDAEDSRGLSALHHAAREGHVEVAQILLSHRPRPVLNGEDIEHFTPLMYAVMSGRAQLVEELWNVITQDLPHQRAGSHQEVLTLASALLDRATDENIHQEVARLLLSKLEGLDEILEYLALDPGQNLAHWAARFDHASRLLTHILKWQPACVNAKDGLWRTPLHMAVRCNNLNAAKALCLGNGCEVVLANAEDILGLRSLHYAINGQRLDIWDVLLSRKDVKSTIDRENGLRKTYVDAANAVLLGGALFATITYMGWLQPPLGYSPSYQVLPFPAAPDTHAMYVSADRNLGSFYLLNSISFNCAIGSVLVGLSIVYPKQMPSAVFPPLQVARLSLQVACLFLLASAICALAAFAIAGFAVLPDDSGVHDSLKPVLVTTLVLVAIVLYKLYLSALFGEIGYWILYFMYRPSIVEKIVLDGLFGSCAPVLLWCFGTARIVAKCLVWCRKAVDRGRAACQWAITVLFDAMRQGHRQSVQISTDLPQFL